MDILRDWSERSRILDAGNQSGRGSLVRADESTRPVWQLVWATLQVWQRDRVATNRWLPVSEILSIIEFAVRDWVFIVNTAISLIALLRSRSVFALKELTAKEVLLLLLGVVTDVLIKLVANGLTTLVLENTTLWKNHGHDLNTAIFLWDLEVNDLAAWLACWNAVPDESAHSLEESRAVFNLKLVQRLAYAWGAGDNFDWWSSHALDESSIVGNGWGRRPNNWHDSGSSRCGVSHANLDWWADFAIDHNLTVVRDG